MNKKNISFFLSSIVLIILNIGFLNYRVIKDVNLNFDNIYKVVLLMIVVITSFFSYFLYQSKKNNWKIENVYLITTIILGIFFMALIPVGSVPDEKSHFLRSYEISEGYLVSDKNDEGRGGRVFSKNLKEVIADNGDISYQELFENLNRYPSSEKEFLLFSNTSLYSFVCYIPQVLGILIGKTLNLSILGMAYMGRVVNFFVFLILMYFSIKHIPGYKNTFLLMSLLPITMQEAISLSPDALTIAIAFSLISFVLYQIKTKKGIMNRNEFIIMFFLTTIMSLCKIVYLPLCLLLFLIPKERFKTTSEKYKKICLLAIFVIVINIIWLTIASNYLVEFQPGVASIEQVKYILENPLRYIQILISTIINKFDFYIFGFLGKSLEWFNIELPTIYPLITLCILTLVIKKDIEIAKWNKKSTKIATTFIFCVTIILIFTSLYVQWTSVGNFIVEGVQGRYFIPCFLLVPMILTSVDKEKKVRKEETWRKENLLMYLVFQNIVALIVIFYHHF